MPDNEMTKLIKKTIERLQEQTGELLGDVVFNDYPPVLADVILEAWVAFVRAKNLMDEPEEMNNG